MEYIRQYLDDEEAPRISQQWYTILNVFNNRRRRHLLGQPGNMVAQMSGNGICVGVVLIK